MNVGIDEARHKEATFAIYDLSSRGIPAQGNHLPFDDNGGVGDTLVAIPYMHILNGSPHWNCARLHVTCMEIACRCLSHAGGPVEWALRERHDGYKTVPTEEWLHRGL